MTRMLRAPACSLALPLALLGAGASCATINPTLTPARVLRRDQVAVDLGSAYAAPLVAPALEAAQSASPDRDAVARAAALHAATPPGPGGYVAVRVGMGGANEGHVALAGAAARLGARRVFWTDEVWAFSLGAQARIAPLALGLAGAVPGLSVPEARAYGADAQALLGRTNSDLYDVWIGLRAGFLRGDLVGRHGQVDGGAAFSATMQRLEAALTFGLRVGFGRVAASAEVEAQAAYAWGSASNGVAGAAAVFALVPAGAITYAF